MTRAATLIFVLIGSMVERSSAVSCYNCEGATCPDPFRAASVPTCNGATCDILYQVSYDPVSGRHIYSYVTRKCTGFAYLLLLDECPVRSEQNNQVNTTFFAYGSSCCYSQSVTLGYAVSYSVNCQCKSDNCNGDLPPLKIPNAGNPSSTAAGFSPQPFSKLSIFFVAMVAVLQYIST